MMGPHKGAKESREGYIRASEALAPPSRLTEEDAQRLGYHAAVGFGHAVWRGAVWLFWLPFKVALGLVLLATLMQAHTEVAASPGNDGIPWGIFAGELLGLTLIVLVVRGLWRRA
jgi:hypothetical protein